MGNKIGLNTLMRNKIGLNTLMGTPHLPFIKICCIASADGDLDGVKLQSFMDAVASRGP